MTSPRFYSRHRQGFTLFELLVVVSIMGIMTAVGASMLHPQTGNPADASEIVSAACNAAQADAIATGAPARVILCIDPTAGTKYLRYVGILVQDANLTTPETTYWRLSAKASSIPAGTLFVADSAYSNVSDTMLYDVNDNQKSQSGTAGFTCTYIEFDPTGQVTNGTNSIQWVFEHGLVNEVARIVGENKKDLDGFIVRRLGKFVYFASPDQISTPTL